MYLDFFVISIFKKQKFRKEFPYWFLHTGFYFGNQDFLFNLVLIFWQLTMLQRSFDLPQVTRKFMSDITNFMYELSHEFPYDFKKMGGDMKYKKNINFFFYLLFFHRTAWEGRDHFFTSLYHFHPIYKLLEITVKLLQRAYTCTQLVIGLELGTLSFRAPSFPTLNARKLRKSTNIFLSRSASFLNFWSFSTFHCSLHWYG